MKSHYGSEHESIGDWVDSPSLGLVWRARTAFKGRPFVNVMLIEHQLEGTSVRHWLLMCFPKNQAPIMETNDDWQPLVRWAIQELLPARQA